MISLDFELHWGMHDAVKLHHYKKPLQNVHRAIPDILSLFKRYNLHATWAIVGMLSFESKQQLLQQVPTSKPTYDNKRLSPYSFVEKIGEDERSDPIHFGRSLIKQIQQTPDQEIATHTFSHFYTKEKGQTIEQFIIDLKQSIQVLESFQKPIESIVFPRNQINDAYLDACHQHGIRTFRGTENHWLYKKAEYHKHPIKRLGRWVDAYWNMTGYHTFDLPKYDRKNMLDLPASRFMRPLYPSTPKWLEKKQFLRIQEAMIHAAKNDQIFHLWWHPHNFGHEIERSVEFLHRICRTYEQLRHHYGMQTLHMQEITALSRANVLSV